jgi:hypothetical protein
VASESLCHLDEDPVTLRVAVGIVHRFEIVEIKKHQGKRLATALCRSGELFKAIGEEATIRQARERIVEGLKGERLLGSLACDL